jgi:hypothetical protein
MPQPDRTTKQIAERFKGNLDYYKKPHYLRRLKWIVASVVTVLAAAVVLAYHCFGPINFYNSGPLSQPHAGFAQDCRKCHESPGRSLAKPNSFAAMDSSCLNCHRGYDFHEPNVPHNYACVACHLEHKGKGRMLPPDLANCTSCHGSRNEMEAAIQAGRNLPPESFHFRPDQGRSVFHVPRPERGYTQVFRRGSSGVSTPHRWTEGVQYSEIRPQTPPGRRARAFPRQTARLRRLPSGGRLR